MQSSKLLINEPPLQVLPSLAKRIDINKAIILQQIQYWIVTAGHEHEGQLWIYNSYSEWSRQFPWLTARAVRWHIKGLEEEGLIVAGDFNEDSRDNTKWYRIDYDRLSDIMTDATGGVSKSVTPPVKKRQVQVSKNDKSTLYTENTTENTTEKHIKLSPNGHVAELQMYMMTILNTDKDCVPNPAKEAMFIKKMERRGFDWERDIKPLWITKVSARREFVSMHWVNEDIGKQGTGKARGAGRVLTGEELEKAWNA